MPTAWYILMGFVVFGTIFYLAITAGHYSCFRKFDSDKPKHKNKKPKKGSGQTYRGNDWEGFCENQIEEREQEGFYY